SMKNALLFLLFYCLSTYCAATTFLVGPGKPYASPNALYQANVINHGDTILIDAATYSGQAALALWSKDNLYISGVGGRPHLQAAGQYLQGKGTWITSGNHITIKNIEFSGSAVPDENGAGIRV